MPGRSTPLPRHSWIHEIQDWTCRRVYQRASERIVAGHPSTVEEDHIAVQQESQLSVDKSLQTTPTAKAHVRPVQRVAIMLQYVRARV